MTIRLHTCGHTRFSRGPHPCWKVKKALEESGIPYEEVKHPAFPRSRRTELERLSGQRKLPVLELDDGTVIRRESGEMADMVRRGEVGSPAGAGAA